MVSQEMQIDETLKKEFMSSSQEDYSIVEFVDKSNGRNFELIIQARNTNFWDIKIVYDHDTRQGRAMFNMDLRKAETLKEILETYTVYHTFVFRNITLNGYNLFGDIFKFGNKDGYEDEKNNAESLLRYWERIKSLEDILNTSFKVKFPLTDRDAETIELLCCSFIDKRPLKTTFERSLDIDIENIEKIDEQLNQHGLFFYILEMDLKGLWGLENKFALTYYYSMKITDYDILEERCDTGMLKARIYIDKYDDESVCSTMVFNSEEEVGAFLRNDNNLELFRTAKAMWEE